MKPTCLMHVKVQLNIDCTSHLVIHTVGHHQLGPHVIFPIIFSGSYRAWSWRPEALCSLVDSSCALPLGVFPNLTVARAVSRRIWVAAVRSHPKPGRHLHGVAEECCRSLWVTPRPRARSHGSERCCPLVVEEGASLPAQSRPVPWPRLHGVVEGASPPPENEVVLSQRGLGRRAIRPQVSPPGLHHRASSTRPCPTLNSRTQKEENDELGNRGPYPDEGSKGNGRRRFSDRGTGTDD